MYLKHDGGYMTKEQLDKALEISKSMKRVQSRIALLDDMSRSEVLSIKDNVFGMVDIMGDMKDAVIGLIREGEQAKLTMLEIELEDL